MDIRKLERVYLHLESQIDGQLNACAYALQVALLMVQREKDFVNAL